MRTFLIALYALLIVLVPYGLVGAVELELLITDWSELARAAYLGIVIYGLYSLVVSANAQE